MELVFVEVILLIQIRIKIERNEWLGIIIKLREIE